MKYKRILLKLSGEALIGNKNFGIDSNKLENYSSEIKNIQNKTINEIFFTIFMDMDLDILFVHC